ncbi:hypothetical protein SODALDRAFT_331570 [Sodiomyces alkalinus F11]|uniref:Uncharacterized protein n=1 Tax=Sodiomyces alkalinus (strain CBS 110278 / VKM F-3762 / F11) TaxID=1314773 RepID=A0A3N2PIT1_SODAK|nr:hypothetical protein SODALDRAFT_331570 [Sodiomyces alkalinus F11]ROT34462.1 hypothetical protein SODALDRAFT_331570 [Sodiomyces alkalinus F11]
MLATTIRIAPRYRGTFPFLRTVSTLASNPRIKVFPADSSRASFLLSYLDTQPPNHRLAIGFSTKDPPTPQSFNENQTFLSILYDVLAEYAPKDKDLIAQARAFAGPGGANLGSGGMFFPQQSKRRSSKSTSAKQGGGGGAGGSGAGGASGQGGAGGGGHAGYVHLSDARNPPDFGRIAWPEDILGSVEVDQQGNIVGKLQPSGTYRIITNEGILGLSPYLTERLVERLKEEEKRDRSS